MVGDRWSMDNFFYLAHMKLLLKYTLALMVFWFLLFFVCRLFFVLYQMPIHGKITQASDLYFAFLHGYRLDLSTATILILLPLILANAYIIWCKPILKKTSQLLFCIMLLLYLFTAIGDAGLYKEWNAKINMQALDHFKNPSEVFKTLGIKNIALFISLLAVFFIPLFYTYKKWIHALLNHNATIPFRQRAVYGLIYFILSCGIGVIFIRGGITNIPINQSVAYFSNDVFANDIAVNPLYNILQDATIKSNIPAKEFYKFRSSDEARQLITDDFPSQNDSTNIILKTQKPNIVFIFLESWSADNVSVLGGIEGCTPQFNALCKEGLLFTQAYANAYVSDQGIPAVLSAYPSVSRIAVINQPAKVPTLPCLSEDLLPLGYTSSFMFGGDLVYGNLRGYLLEKKFSELIEQKDFTQYPQGQLGVHDEYIFPELLKNLNHKKEPFLQCFFTTSTHMPYDYKNKLSWKSSNSDAEKEYTEAVHYSDAHLGKFFSEAKKQTWYNNTLFIVIADHSHNSIKQWSAASAMHSRIPLLMLGGALKDEYKGKEWTNIVSQLDIPATILHQLNIASDKYVLSRNVFANNAVSSAYYIFFGGQGYINNLGYAASHQGNQKHIESNVENDSTKKYLHNKAMSFQQLVYEAVQLAN